MVAALIRNHCFRMTEYSGNLLFSLNNNIYYNAENSFSVNFPCVFLELTNVSDLMSFTHGLLAFGLQMYYS
jgi:hypothetical protein